MAAKAAIGLKGLAVILNKALVLVQTCCVLHHVLYNLVSL